MQTHGELAHLEGHVAQVLTVAFNAGGDQLVSGGADQQLKVWDVKTKERTNTLGTHSTSVNSAVWIPANAAIYAVTDGGELDRYTELKAASGAQNGESSRETRFTSAGEPLCCVAASADGEHVYAGSQEGRIIVWNKEKNIVTQIDVNAIRPLASAAP
jgi:WD40 repeat protein